AADDTQRLVLGGPAFLSVEVDQQHQIGRVASERRLDGVMHLGIGVYRAFALDRDPWRLWAHAPRTGGRGRGGRQVTGGTRLQVEAVLGAKPEKGEVLDVEVVEAQRHP